MVIRRIGALSCAKVAGVLYAILGVVFGAFFSLAAVAGAMASDQGGAAGAIFGVGAVIVVPILYGSFGFVATLVMALLYNVVASMVGGVDIDVA